MVRDRSRARRLVTAPKQRLARCVDTWLRRDRAPCTVCTFLLSLFVFAVISAGLLALGKHINSEGLAVTRFTASEQAPMVARLYPDHARDRIAVVLYDDKYLTDQEAAWPLPYYHHAQLVLHLASLPAPPKAIFLDITFSQLRDDPSVAELHQALCQARHDFGVPVFLAADHSYLDLRSAVRTELLRPDEQGRACAGAAGVRATPDPIDRQTWSYPLTTHSNGTEWVSGATADDAATRFRSAAMILAQDVERLALGTETTPMALFWGSGVRPRNAFDEVLQCQPDIVQGWQRFVPSFVRERWAQTSDLPLCPYHDAVSVGQIRDMSEDQLTARLAGRYVMIGAMIPGYDDLADSPVHGAIPGIFVHAMALDNLLVYGSAYKRDVQWEQAPLPLYLGAAATILVVFTSHVIVRRLFERLGVRVRRARHDRASYRTSRARRVLAFSATAAYWLVNIVIQASLAMAAVAVLQLFLPVGMLPVMELVGMVILAEGLGHLERARSFLRGLFLKNRPAPASPAAAASRQ